MFSLIIALLKKEQLTGEYYATWKLKLNMILVITNLRFVLMEKCPPFPTQNASKIVRDAYDRWTRPDIYYAKGIVSRYQSNLWLDQ